MTINYSTLRTLEELRALETDSGSAIGIAKWVRRVGMAAVVIAAACGVWLLFGYWGA